MSYLRNKKGFTFLELCIILTIVAILTGAAIPSAKGIVAENEQKKKDEMIIFWDEIEYDFLTRYNRKGYIAITPAEGTLTEGYIAITSAEGTLTEKVTYITYKDGSNQSHTVDYDMNYLLTNSNSKRYDSRIGLVSVATENIEYSLYKQKYIIIVDRIRPEFDGAGKLKEQIIYYDASGDTVTIDDDYVRTETITLGVSIVKIFYVASSKYYECTYDEDTGTYNTVITRLRDA